MKKRLLAWITKVLVTVQHLDWVEHGKSVDLFLLAPL